MAIVNNLLIQAEELPNKEKIERVLAFDYIRFGSYVQVRHNFVNALRYVKTQLINHFCYIDYIGIDINKIFNMSFEVVSDNDDAIKSIRKTDSCDLVLFFESLVSINFKNYIDTTIEFVRKDNAINFIFGEHINYNNDVLEHHRRYAMFNDSLYHALLQYVCVICDKSVNNILIVNNAMYAPNADLYLSRWVDKSEIDKMNITNMRTRYAEQFKKAVTYYAYENSKMFSMNDYIAFDDIIDLYTDK